MKIDKPLVRRSNLVNVSIHREVLDTTEDFLDALIVEFIHYKYLKNNKKPVWLKINWIHEKLPYISRTGLAKKLKKLEDAKHIIVKRGKGRHYHKCWYSVSPDLRASCNGKGTDTSKVYYNLDMAKQNLEASVVYAAIVNLLKVEENPMQKVRGIKKKIGYHYGRTDDALLLDYQKLCAGSGLTIRKVRKAVRWLIDNNKVVAKQVFGNKQLVSLPPDTVIQPADLESYFSQEPPTECFPHADPAEAPPTECFPHQS